MNSLKCGYVLFALYGLYAVIGGVFNHLGRKLPFELGNIGEFFLFFVATVLFVHGVLHRAAEKQGRSLWQVLNEDAERYAMLVFYVFVCAVIVQEVLRRFGLNFSSAWAQETAQYAFIYLGYIGASYAVKERAHIRFDLMFQKLPPRYHGYVYLFAELCTLLFACIALYWTLHTVKQLLTLGGATPVLRVNKTWAEAALPLAFSLMIFRCLQMMLRDWQDIRAGRTAYAGKSMFEE